MSKIIRRYVSRALAVIMTKRFNKYKVRYRVMRAPNAIDKQRMYRYLNCLMANK